MKLRLLLLGPAIFLVFLFSACDPVDKLTSTKIKDILDHPRNYENKKVTIYGTVTNAVSLLVVKYFEIQNDSGAIKVATDKLLPTKGVKSKVTGQMTAIEIGTERWIALGRRATNGRKSVQMFSH